MSSFLERKAERAKRIAERSNFSLREEREARLRIERSKVKPFTGRPKKDDLDPAKTSMWWMQRP